MELQWLSSLSEPQVEPVLKETKGKGIVASTADIKVNYGLFEIVLILGNNIDMMRTSEYFDTLGATSLVLVP